MKKTFLLLLSFLFLHACNKEEPVISDLQKILAQQRDGLPSPIQILNLLEQPTDGYVWLKSFTGPANDRPITELGGFISGTWDLNYTGSSLNFGLMTTTMAASGSGKNFSNVIDFNYQFENIYGTSQNVQIGLQANPSQFVLNSNFYIPKHLSLTNYIFQLNQKPNWHSGSPISWVADGNNSHGIGIAVVYDPEKLENKVFQPTHPNRTVNPIHTLDDGQYTFDNADFQGIPAGADVDIYIGRGNYQIAQLGSNGKKVGVYSYSVKLIPVIFGN